MVKVWNLMLNLSKRNLPASRQEAHQHSAFSIASAIIQPSAK
jgi:hypothetical protein